MPLDNRGVAAVVVAALLPGVPLHFVTMPVQDLLQKILNILT